MKKSIEKLNSSKFGLFENHTLSAINSINGGQKYGTFKNGTFEDCWDDATSDNKSTVVSTGASDSYDLCGVDPGPGGFDPLQSFYATPMNPNSLQVAFQYEDGSHEMFYSMGGNLS